MKVLYYTIILWCLYLTHYLSTVVYVKIPQKVTKSLFLYVIQNTIYKSLDL